VIANGDTFYIYLIHKHSPSRHLLFFRFWRERESEQLYKYAKLNKLILDGEIGNRHVKKTTDPIRYLVKDNIKMGTKKRL
jgi:hypothetical protein